eukprot:2637049-Rhodomonas_salina.1
METCCFSGRESAVRVRGYRVIEGPEHVSARLPRCTRRSVSTGHRLAHRTAMRYANTGHRILLSAPSLEARYCSTLLPCVYWASRNVRVARYHTAPFAMAVPGIA